MKTEIIKVLIVASVGAFLGGSLTLASIAFMALAHEIEVVCPDSEELL